MSESEKTIYVYCDWGEEGPTLIGRMYINKLRGKESFAFEYSKDWLSNVSKSLFLDPDLAMFQGRQYTPLNKAQFGMFADSCPDRWGRLLMNRRESIIARKEERKPRKLTESDYLLGVYDESRMGALRFALEENGQFLSYDKELAAPPWASLRKLEAASFAFEQDENSFEEKWLNQLLAPGSSLGGARPKANVQNPDGSLWIAKFPSKHDEYNTGAWEMVIHELAVKCELNVPDAMLGNFSKNGSTFLVKRFDRNERRRIHFASAMTLLGRTDGSDDVSYLDIASFIKANGSSPRKDLQELWKRIVFNIAVSNTDDHLRNHGFILDQRGWRLSPLYDVNPCIYGDVLSLNINQINGSVDFELAKETAEYYGIKADEAKREIEGIKSIVQRNWKTIAAKYGISRSEMEYMSPAFEMNYK